MPAFIGAEADAAACFSHSRRFSLLPPHPQAFPLMGRGVEWRTPVSLPLEGSAVLNDTPVACQIREPTDPQGDRCPRRGRMRCRRTAAQAHYLSPTAPFLPTAEEMGERTPAETAFLHFLSALYLFAAVRFPSRNRRFPDRCRSPDCASTAFHCRCLLLRQKLFVLPCRRLRNNYIPCPTGTPTFAAARRQRRDLIIATRPAHQPLPSLLSAAAAQEVQAIPEPTTMSPTALHARVHTAKSA